MAKPIKNFELLQSYILTTARYDFTVYEKRIMYCVLKNLQHLLSGQKLNEQVTITEDLFGNKRFEIPIKDVLSALPASGDSKERSTNHAQVKKALWSLRRKDFEYRDEKNDIERLIGIIEKPEVRHRSEMISFDLDPVVIEAFLNFAKGYRKYIFEVAMSFESVYTMRFYELFSNQHEPITYSIASIKEMFQISDKKSYNKISNLKAKVLDPAKKELDEKSPYSFAYKMIKTGRKATHVLFTPYKIPKNQPADIEQKELNSQVSPYWTVSPELAELLIKHFGYDKQTIKNHKKILKLVTKHLDFVSILRENYKYIITTADVIPAFVYGMFKRKLAEKGIYVDGTQAPPMVPQVDIPAEEWEQIQNHLDSLKKK